VEIYDEQYERYYQAVTLPVDWDRATQVIRNGEPDAEFFTLPWWQTESRSIYLYGADYNKARLTELRRTPGKKMRGRALWRPAVLYPGVPDEWTPIAVGVMTQAGHIGCVAGDVCTAGLGKLVRALADAGEYFAVPVHVSPSDAEILTPDGADMSAFDYPWVGEEDHRYRKPARISRSHVIGLMMIKRGITPRWHALAQRIAAYGEESGVTVSAPLPLFRGARVMVSLRDPDAEAVIEKAARLTGFEAIPRPRGIIDKQRAKQLGKIDALITRYPDSDVPVCQYARANRIPIYRPDEFIGGLAEAVLREYGMLSS
jgi:hypothetical protein